MMKIYVCSPFRSNDLNAKERNITAARKICETIIEAGARPVAPHLFYPQLDITDEKGREIALKDLADCDAMIVYKEFGTTAGMEAEIERAKQLRIAARDCASLTQIDDEIKRLIATGRNKRLTDDEIAALDKETKERAKFLRPDTESKPLEIIPLKKSSDDFPLPNTTRNNFVQCEVCQ
jgi:hypothetical protein